MYVWALVALLALCRMCCFARDDGDAGKTDDPAQQRIGGPVPRPGPNWKRILRESAIFLGVEHSFRLATEYDTRHPKGPFLQGYLDSVGNLHGWADGDPIYVNYVGHPMQGAVAGYIWSQNDIGYTKVAFGRRADYWRSRIRAAGWMWAYSTQFEIGPVSEASIGYIQKQYPQVGFVDHVSTPVFGLGWMVTEDALDRFLITPFEQRVANPYLRLLVRGGLNPSRSFANAMRGKVPWARDNRAGVWSYPVGKPASGVLPSAPVEIHQIAPYEVQSQTGIIRFPGAATCVGGGAAFAARFRPTWQWVFAVNGCKLIGLDHGQTGDALRFVTGPRWTPRPDSPVSPYAHFLLGGQKITVEQVDPQVKQQLEALFAAGKRKEEPLHDEYTNTAQAAGFSLEAGSGIDWRLGRAFALRLPALTYARTWMPSVMGREYNAGLQLTGGVILRLGTW